ncbi:DUF6262 family protein [Rhodococcus rhodnii]|nr:DUF6262 family protein [Rhodococcus rhodnii]
MSASEHHESASKFLISDRTGVRDEMANPMIDGRRADTERRRQRVVKALNTSSANGTEISVSAIARAAGVDRTFLYRHKDLLAQIHTAQLVPPETAGNPAPTTRESLRADLANAQQHIARLSTHNRQLQLRLSAVLGEQVWRESGLGAPPDIDHLQQRIALLEQSVMELTSQLDERDQELDAARAANRELFANTNRQLNPR